MNLQGLADAIEYRRTQTRWLNLLQRVVTAKVFDPRNQQLPEAEEKLAGLEARLLEIDAQYETRPAL
jgi:hypothetical protein